MRRKIIYTGLLCSLGLAIGCGGSDDGDSTPSSIFSAGEVSLEKFPSLSGLVSQEAQSSLGLAVSGTPVALKELSTDADTYFFGGSIAALVDDNATPTDEIRGNMERGQAVCGMAANAGELIRRLEGGTLCYMGEIAKLPSAALEVTKESATVTGSDHSEVFKQEAADKTVRVDVTDSRGEQAAHIKIIGTDNAPSSYKIEFFMCEGPQGSQTVKNSESYEIDYAAGSYTRSEVYSGDEGDHSYTGSMSVTAFLKKLEDGSFAFDSSKDRVIAQEGNDSGTHNSQTYSNKRNMNMRIDSDGNLHTLIYRTDEGNDYSSSEKIWSMAEFTGSGLDLGLSQMAMKMDRSNTYMEETHSQDGVGGAVEWQDTAYKGTEEGAYYAAFEAKDMAAESFFATAPAEKTFNASAYDCNEEVDVVIAVDFDSDAVAPVKEACDGGNDDNLDFHSMCYDSRVQDAFNKLYQAPPQN